MQEITLQGQAQEVKLLQPKPRWIPEPGSLSHLGGTEGRGKRMERSGRESSGPPRLNEMRLAEKQLTRLIHKHYGH